MKASVMRFEDLVVWQNVHEFALTAAVCLNLPPPRNLWHVVSIAAHHRPPLPRTLRKGSKDAEKRADSAFTASPEFPSKNLEPI
jgi:hypothetical protein